MMHSFYQGSPRSWQISFSPDPGRTCSVRLLSSRYETPSEHPILWLVVLHHGVGKGDGWRQEIRPGKARDEAL